jgi:membrane-associated phospholipid phosphatase
MRFRPTLPVLISAWSLMLFALLTAAVIKGTALALDMRVRSAVHASASRSLTLAATILSAMAMLSMLIPASAVIAICFSIQRRYRAATAVVVTMGGAILLNAGLKIAIERPRPLPFFGSNPETFSFPSGHVLFATCFLGGLVLLLEHGTKARTLAWPVVATAVCAVAWSRVYLGAHYPSDVVAGLLIGFFWLAALCGAGLFRMTGAPSPPLERLL